MPTHRLRFKKMLVWALFSITPLIATRIARGEDVSLWTLHTADLGSFKVVIDKDHLRKLKKIDVLRENASLSPREAATAAAAWAKRVHGEHPEMKVENVDFISESGVDHKFSYYKVTIFISNDLLVKNGERKPTWENIPVTLDGRVLDRIAIDEEND